MRKYLIIISFLLGTAFAARAQEELAFRPVFSIEIGTGYPPIHTLTASSYTREKELAEKGLEIVDKQNAFYPVINLTGVYRPWKRAEFTFSAGASWCHHQLKQHPQFGVDPNGKPRYDWSKGTMAGWTDSTPCFMVAAQCRYLWTPSYLLVLYSGTGWGIVFGSRFIAGITSVLPVPSLTPIGLRTGGKHFYAYAEGTIGPLATFIHGGLGWHF